jgi:hypothetical protein
MTFIVSNVLWWLAATVVFALLAICSQLRNIYRISSKMLDLSDPLDFSSMQKKARGMILGFIPVAVCGLGAAVCFVLFIIGVIGYFVQKA